MNIQIGDYEEDSIILDLGSDLNILKKTNMAQNEEADIGLVPYATAIG